MSIDSFANRPETHEVTPEPILRPQLAALRQAMQPALRMVVGMDSRQYGRVVKTNGTERNHWNNFTQVLDTTLNAIGSNEDRLLVLGAFLDTHLEWTVADMARKHAEDTHEITIPSIGRFISTIINVRNPENSPHAPKIGQ